MTSEQAFILSILSDYLQSKKTEQPSNIDWSEIIKLSTAHQIDGIVYYQCKSFLPDVAAQSLQQRFTASIFCYANRVSALKEIEKTLTNRKIKYVTVKGLDVAGFYPIPALRTMGDSDFVVHPEDMTVAAKIFLELGYKGSEFFDVHDWECVRNGLHIELHDVLVKDDEHIVSTQKRFFNNYDNFVFENRLVWSFHFLYVLMHLRKHFIHHGVGIRQFMDLAVLISKCSAINWEFVDEKLNELNLRKFADACFSIISYWFNIAVPLKTEALETGFIESITVKILNDGVFGHAESSNKNNAVLNYLSLTRGCILFRRIKLLGKKMFPRYKKMRTYPGCGYLIKHRYLLPVAWIQRLLHILRKKGNQNVFNVLKKYFVNKTSVDNQYDYLKKMGL